MVFFSSQVCWKVVLPELHQGLLLRSFNVTTTIYDGAGGGANEAPKMKSNRQPLLQT
jgi:hypothetical protein